MEADRTYFSRRAAEEKNAARHALHPASRKAHLELSMRYHDLAHHQTDEQDPATKF
jgi:hypothetical protein